MSSFSPHPPRGAGPEPVGAVSSSPAAAAHSAHTPGLGTERQGLLRLLRSGSARGHRDARGRRGPSGPAAQRGPRGRPGAAAAAAAAAGASAKRYSRGTGWGLHPLSGRAKAPHWSQAVAGLGPLSPSAMGSALWGERGEVWSKFPFHSRSWVEGFAGLPRKEQGVLFIVRPFLRALASTRHPADGFPKSPPEANF